MIGDLPCGENLFKAETALEFERVAMMESPGPPAPTLSELVPSLLFPPTSGLSTQAEEHVTAANMLMLICGMPFSVKGDETATEHLQRYNLLL